MVEEIPSNNAGRIPPQDITAEKSLIGSILLSDEAFPEVLEQVKFTDFYEPRHRKIYRAMTNLYEKHSAIDVLTVTAELRALKALKEIGGAAYLTELSNYVPVASHAKDYANIVEKMATRRRLIQAGTDIVTKAYEEGSELGELIGQAERALFEVSDQNTKTEYSSLSDLLVDAFDRIETLHKNRGTLRGLKTGFTDIDKKTAGLQKGDLVIIGARPAMGKTTLAQNIAYNVASYNKRGVLFFSMEMAKAEIVDRIISTISGVSSWNIRTGNLSDEDFSRIGEAMGEMDEIPLYVDDTSSMTILELRNKARRAAHNDDIGLIIIDYLQLLQGSDRYAGNRVQEVTEISRGLKTLARELEVPVVALAQLSRNLTNRDNLRPQLQDLRESGSIEQDADLVMFLHREDYYRQQEEGYEPTNITELIIAKHRHGPVGTIELFFDKDRLRFMNLDKEHE